MIANGESGKGDRADIKQRLPKSELRTWTALVVAAGFLGAILVRWGADEEALVWILEVLMVGLIIELGVIGRRFAMRGLTSRAVICGAGVVLGALIVVLSVYQRFHGY